MRRFLSLAGAGLLAACTTVEPTPTAPYVHAEGRKIMEEGHPYPDGPCRLLGETYTTSELLDDSALLLACPADAMRDSRVSSIGRVVGQYEGVILVSVPKARLN